MPYYGSILEYMPYKGCVERFSYIMITYCFIKPNTHLALFTVIDMCGIILSIESTRTPRSTKIPTSTISYPPKA